MATIKIPGYFEDEPVIKMTAATDSKLTELSEVLLSDYNAWDEATADLLLSSAAGYCWPQDGSASFTLDDTDLKAVSINGITSQHVWMGFEGSFTPSTYRNVPKEDALASSVDPMGIFNTTVTASKKHIKSILDWLYALPPQAAPAKLDPKIPIDVQVTKRWVTDKPLVLLLYKGPYFVQSLELTPNRNWDGTISDSYIRVNIKSRVTLSVPASHVAFKGIMSALKKVPKWKDIARIALKHWYDLSSFPPLFDLSIPVNTNLGVTGVVKIGTDFYYFPPSSAMEYDQRSKVFQRIIEGSRSSLPSNTIISLDAKGGKLTYTDSGGSLQEFLIGSALKVTAEDIVGVLKRPVYDVLLSTQKGSLPEIYNFWAFSGEAVPNLRQTRDFLFENTNVSIGDVEDKARLKEFLVSLKTYMESRLNQLSPITWFHFMGLVRLIYDNIDKYRSLKTAAEEKRKAFNEATSDGVPSIPYLSEDFAYFPHQAEALAKMDKAGETAILDVGTGGGKTGLQISDALNLMSKGKIKRPLNVMPNALCGQFAGEVINFTGGELNAFVLNTDTKNSWGEDYLWSSAASAPINTYFITSYEFLTAGAVEYEWGVEFPNVDKIKELLDPDWISLDECLTGDSLIRTTRGLERIDSLVPNAKINEVVDIDIPVITRNGEFRATSFKKMENRVRRVTTTFGYSVKGTDNHPFLVITDKMNLKWKRLDELNEGDVICIDTQNTVWPIEEPQLEFNRALDDEDYHYNTRLYGMPERMSPALAKVLGYLIAEGCISQHNNRIEFTNYDHDILEDYKKSWVEAFPEVPIYMRKDENRCYSGGLILKEFMQHLGMEKKSRKKEIPPIILISTKESVTAFIRAYMEGDGGVNGKVLTATSGSMKLLRQLHVLLLQFGIVSKFRHEWDTRWSPAKRHVNLHIPREWIGKYMELIGFVSDMKTDTVEDRGLNEVKGPVWRHDTIPYLHQTRMRVRELYGCNFKGRYRTQEGTEEMLSIFPMNCGAVKGYCQSGYITREYVRKELERGHIHKVNSELARRLQVLVDSGFFFDTVESIGKYKKAFVYDITVDKEHSFIANGFVVHNCHFIKNASSKRHQAIMQLNGADYRRIATGTLITNKPTDLPGQVEFLDPMAVGDMPEFLARYYRGSNPKDNAAELIRDDLRLRSFYLVYREKDWAAFLPKPVFTDYFVDMTEGQKKIYRSIVEQVMEEIRNDPKLNQAWQKLIEMGEESDLDYLPQQILPKMMRLEMYLTAPDVSEFGTKVLSPEDLISPKISKIDELIGQSIKAGGKVIVAVHYKHSARHLLEKSKYKAASLYYDATVKKNLQEFKTNPNVKVLFAVQNSITEGVNLQIADRIIVADVDWTPGKLKQLMARIYRPSIKKGEEGEYINANAEKTIYIDTVLANHSADCVKWAFQMRKKVFNAQIMEGCKVEIPPSPSFGEDALTANFESSLIQGPTVKARGDEYNKWFIDLVEKSKEENPVVKFIKPSEGKQLKGSAKIDVPWVRGMLVSADSSTKIPLAEWLENENLSLDDLTEHKSRLIGLTVETDSGLGSIVGVSIYSVRVKLEDRTVYTVTPHTCFVIVNPKVNSKKAGKEKKADSEAPSLKKKEKELVKVTPKGIVLPEYGLEDIVKDVKEAKERSKKRLEPDPDIHETEKVQVGEREFDTSEEDRVSQKPAKVVKEKEVKPAKPPVVDKKKKSQEKAEEEGEEGRDWIVSLEFVLINGMPSIIAWPEDPDTSNFPDFGFRWSRPIWEYQIKSRPQANAILDRLEDRFNIPEDLLEQCREVIKRSAKGRYNGQPVTASELKNFYRLTLFKKAKAGTLKLYPLVWMGTPYLVLDMKSHPGIQLGRYKFHKSTDPFLYRICRNKMELKQALIAIRKSGLSIDNLDEFKTQAKRSNFKI